MEKKTNTPALRFHGFWGEWEKKNIGDTFRLTRGEVLAVNKTSSKKAITMSFPVYSSQTANHGLMGYYSQYLFENAITWTTDGANAGTVNYRAGKFYCTNVCGVLLNDAGYANPAIATALNRKAWKYVSKVGNPKLMNNVMAEINIYMPLTIEEQKSISAFLLSFDALLINQEQKVKKLEQFRQAMLTKLFPAEGASEPALRFRGFSSPWKRCELGSIADFNPKCELPERFEYVDLESVVGTQIIAHRTETKSTAPSRAQRLAQKGDIFYQTVRPYQKNNCLFDSDDQNYVFSSGYAQLRPHGDSSFLLALMQTDIFVNEVLNHCTGTSFPAVSSNDLAGIIVTFPASFDEQKKIGDFFHRLDLYISLQKEKLDKLRLLKAALLDKLFV